MTKISQLTATTTTVTTDEYALARSGANNKITFDDLRKGISSFVRNTIFVDTTYGNDLTGEVENQAKPFATIAAAHVASQGYFTGATAPTFSNVVTMKISGDYVEDVTILSYHNYDISGAYIEGEIIDDGVAAICSIYGAGTIGVANLSGITCSAASELIIEIENIYGGIFMGDSSSTLNIYNTKLSYTGSLSNFYLCKGTVRVYNSYIVASAAKNVTFDSSGSIEFNNCILIAVQQNIRTNATSANTSYIYLYDCYVKTTGTNLSTIELTTTTGGNVTVTIKNCTLIANGTGNSIRAAQATNVYVYGSNQTNLTHDTGDVTLLVGTVANGRFLIDAATV